MLQIREHLRAYARDTYLGKSMPLNPNYSVIDCAVGSSQWGISSYAQSAHKTFDPTSATIYSEKFHREIFIPNLLTRFNLPMISPEQVFLGHGSFNLGERIAHKLIKPGKLLGVGPQFVEIPSEFIAAGFTYEPIPLNHSFADGFQFPLNEIFKKLGTSEYTALYLDNPNNPLGYHMDNEIIADIAKRAEQFGCIVLLDEAYGDFLPDFETSAALCDRFSNLIVIRSLSKAYGIAGLRVGYTIMSQELACFYKQLDVPFEPTTYSIVVGDAVMKDVQFITSVRSKVAEDKSRILRAFREKGILVLPTHPSTSIMTIALLRGGNICEMMASIGVAIENGSFFSSSHPQWGDQYCRFRIPAPHLVDELIKRVETL